MCFSKYSDNKHRHTTVHIYFTHYVVCKIYVYCGVCDCVYYHCISITEFTLCIEFHNFEYISLNYGLIFTTLCFFELKCWKYYLEVFSKLYYF
jgi:hypothetical protein